MRGKVALITGGSRGIGRAIGLKLASLGADVAIVYAGNVRAAEATVTEIEKLGARAAAFMCDVSDFAACGRTAESVKERFGRIDILVNCAGITRDGLVMRMREEDFDAVIATNLKGAFNMIRHCARSFARQRSGKIINISSVSGLCGNVGQANYSASKAGLVGLTKSVARELAGWGITCNAIAPGFISTDMTAGLENMDRITESIPLKRVGTPEEVAELAAFLAGDGANYITGEVIRVDGGMAM